MPNDEFVALVTRLDRASDLLRNGGSLLQAIARRYYLVYAYATQTAEKHALHFRRGVDIDDARRVTHQILPDIVRALYTGQNVGPVVGGGPRRNAEWAIDRRRSGSVC
jgi:hypothetical protein